MNRRYERPWVVSSSDYAEGVFAASGDESISGISYTVKQTNAWDGNRQYDITVTNNTSRDVAEVVIAVPVYGDVSYVGGNWNSAVLEDSSVTLTFDNWKNGIRAGGSVTVYTHVVGSGDFSIG